MARATSSTACTAYLYKSDYAGTAEHTLLSFDSSDPSCRYGGAERQGVEFLDYDLPDLEDRER